MQAKTGDNQNFSESNLAARPEIFPYELSNCRTILHQFKDFGQTEQSDKSVKSGQSGEFQNFKRPVHTVGAHNRNQVGGETAA